MNYGPELISVPSRLSASERKNEDNDKDGQDEVFFSDYLLLFVATGKKIRVIKIMVYLLVRFFVRSITQIETNLIVLKEKTDSKPTHQALTMLVNGDWRW